MVVNDTIWGKWIHILIQAWNSSARCALCTFQIYTPLCPSTNENDIQDPDFVSFKAAISVMALKNWTNVLTKENSNKNVCRFIFFQSTKLLLCSQ